MATATETVTMSTPNTKTDKKTLQKKIVTIRLPSSVLARFAPKPIARKNSRIKSSPDTASTPTLPADDAPLDEKPTDNLSESPSTPAPSGEMANGDGVKKKSGPGSRGGVKRGLGDGSSRPRGRPGPKKRKLDDATADTNVKTSFGGVVPITGGHKLGPKANQGAINAGLRALDRSGKPCRKWEKKPIQLKSFTGVAWDLPSWNAPLPKEMPNGDVNGVSHTGESESKPNESSTAMESEKSNHGEQADPMAMSTPLASSPPPVITTTAADET